jgi:glycosyltransferase involved in cell wall biosynthesis
VTESVAIVTICRGRLAHLQQTLPHMVAEGPDELVVVDYDCPEGTEEWVRRNHPEVTVIKATDPNGWCAAKARNIGARGLKSDWIMFADADVRLKGGVVPWIREHARPNHFYLIDKRAKRRIRNLEGTVICSRADYLAVGGYDEAFRLWGGEDKDFYYRLADNEVRQAHYPPFEIQTIPHDNALRTAQYDLEDFTKHNLTTKAYLNIKKAIFAKYVKMNREECASLFFDIKNLIAAKQIKAINTLKIPVTISGYRQSVRVVFYRKYLYRGNWKMIIAA